jgi:acyl-CoA thioesterase-1
MRTSMHRISHTISQYPGSVWLSRLLLVVITIVLLTACSGNTTNAGKRTNTSAAPHPVVTPTPFSQPITYVALGASDAVGVGSDTPGSQGYVPLISSRLPKGSHALNLGISGIHLHEALNEELPLALNTSPQLITIWLVANDFVGGVGYQSYISDLSNLLAQLHARTNARIIMANLPDLTRLPTFRHDTSGQKASMLQSIKHWNQGIAQIAIRDRIAIVDLFQDGSELTSHPNYISGDGFHPSSQGYVRLAQLFWQVIQE